MPWVPGVPNTGWVSDLFEALLHEELGWKRLVRQRQSLVKRDAMDHDWATGGAIHAASLKPPVSPPLSSMARHEELTVQPLRTAKGSLARYRLVHGPVPKPGSVWKFGSAKISVASCGDNVVTLSKPFSSAMWARSAVQLSWTSDPDFMACKVCDYWKSFWHTEKEPDMSFIQNNVHHLPELPCFEANISARELDFVLRKLPGRKARGLDGFSYSEFKCLGPQHRSMLLSLLNHFTVSAQWPKQLTTAVVSLLVKVDAPAGPADARPIAVLSSTYRLWSKCITIKVLKHLQPFLPAELFGSVPGKSALDMAWMLQSSFLLGTNVSGVSMDLSKAFNLIPREPLDACCRRLGWPPSIRKAYQALLRQICRYFRIAGSFHGPLDSRVGVPEGDPLAVTAMLVITWFTSARQRAVADAPLYSYVDNWSVQHEDVYTLQLALAAADETIQALAMILALDKLKFYSTDFSVRKSLRRTTFVGQPLQVVHDFQDLGVFFCAAKRQSAKGFNGRFVACQARFQRLQIMPWSDSRKSSSLARVVLPAVLYGSELTHIAPTGFKLLRARCSSSLWGPGSHRDHFLAPLLSAADIYEPFLLVFLQRWRTLQRMLRRYPATTLRQWNTVLDSGSSTLCGPITYFFEQVYFLGWEPLRDGCVRDVDGISWKVALVSKKHIASFVQDAWLASVIQHVRQDEQFAGVQPFNVARVRKSLHVHGTYNSCRANYAVGAILSTQVKAKFMPREEALCPLCGQEGGPGHILFSCGATQKCRDLLDLSVLDGQPNYVKIAGLFPETPLVAKHRAFLMSIPDQVAFPPLDDAVHLFVDGSTIHGNDSTLVLAGWSLMLAEEGLLESACVASGPLPGVLQSKNRAELYGVLQAMLIGREGVIYSDSKYAVDGVRRIQFSGWVESHWASADNYDLWARVGACLASAPTRWQMVKVRSHQQASSSHTAFENWCIFHNDAADARAKQVFVSRDVDFLQNYTELQTVLASQHGALRVLASLQDQVTTLSKHASSSRCSLGHFPVQDALQLQLERIAMSGNDRSIRIPNAGLELDLQGFILHGPYALLLWSFLGQQRWVADPHGFPLYELYVAFAEKTGWVAPINIHGLANVDRPAHLRTVCAGAAWVHPTDWSHLCLTRQSLSAQLRIFLYVLREIFKRQQVPWEISRQRALHCLYFNLPVQTSQFRPCSTCDGSSIRTLLRHQSGGSFFASIQKSYSPESEPLQPLAALQDLDSCWRAYKARLRR